MGAGHVRPLLPLALAQPHSPHHPNHACPPPLPPAGRGGRGRRPEQDHGRADAAAGLKRRHARVLVVSRGGGRARARTPPMPSERAAARAGLPARAALGGPALASGPERKIAERASVVRTRGASALGEEQPAARQRQDVLTAVRVRGPARARVCVRVRCSQVVVRHGTCDRRAGQAVMAPGQRAGCTYRGHGRPSS